MLVSNSTAALEGKFKQNIHTNSMGPWLPDPRADQIQEAGSRATQEMTTHCLPNDSGEKLCCTPTCAGILEVIISQDKKTAIHNHS